MLATLTMITQRSSTAHRSIVSVLALAGSALYALSFLELIDPQAPHRSLLDGVNQPVLKLLPGGGRIGDQLFMYAALLRLSHEHKMKPCIVKVFRRIPIQKMFVGPYEWCEDETHDVEWEGGWQAERVAKLRRREGDSGLVYALSGYMHSPSNFVPYSPGLVYDALTLREDSDAYRRAREVLKAVDDDGDDSIIKVGVHVRRGDKVTNKHYQTADADYFLRAMNYIRSKYSNDDSERGNARRRVKFIVTSDSMPWVQKRTEVFGADDVTLVEHPFDVADPYDAFDSSQTDLAVLMQCDHIILSGGGFGFWAAFLGPHRKGGEVIVGDVQEKTMNSLDEWTNIDDEKKTTNDKRDAVVVDDVPSSDDEQVLAVE